MLKVHCGKPNDWKGCENWVKGVVKKHMINEGTREIGPDSEVENGRRFQDILVENVSSCIRVSPVRFTSMNKHQVLQELELANGIVWSFNSLLSLQSTDAYSNMCCINHIHIISTISNCQSSKLWVSILYHHNNFSLLFRANSAGKNYICSFTQINEPWF